MTPQPNIILILTDHFRRDALGPSTPHLMKLAAQGTRFSNAYSVAPVCQASRNCIITGMYPSQHGICGNQSPPLTAELRQDTFMHHLQKAGYYTAMIGKHHYIDRFGLEMDVRADDEAIKAYGFDFVFQVVDDGENGHNDDEYTAFLQQQGRLAEFREALQNRADPFQHPFTADESAEGFIGLKGVDFVKNHDQAQPFYLNLSFIGPHPPLWHPNESQHQPEAMTAPLGAPDDPQTRLKRAHYMDKCALIDHYVGQLVAALQQRNMLEKTVIIFSSDHGDCLGDFGIWDKRYFYESSVGVPLFFCGPGIPSQERRNGPRLSRALVTQADLYPTILSLAGLEPQPDRRRIGRNLVEIAQGQMASGHQAVVAELATATMIRTANWKLVFDPEQGGVQQLYNLAIDPTEENNLAGVAGYESVTLDLVQQLLAHHIRRTQFTHIKEEQRLQRVHIS